MKTAKRSRLAIYRALWIKLYVRESSPFISPLNPLTVRVQRFKVEPTAGCRRLRRAQSAVSELVSSLEDQIGVMLFDRSGRYPKLTSEGAVLLADARGIVAGVDFMKARAKGIAAGLEPDCLS